MAYAAKVASFTVSRTLIPLGATLSDGGFRHYGYREEIRLSVDSPRLIFSAEAQSVPQAKLIAVSSLRSYYSPAQITGEVAHYVDGRISAKWVTPGNWPKRGQRCSGTEYRLIRQQVELLNSSGFMFTQNDEYGHQSGSIVPVF